MESSAEFLLEMRNITKTFPGVKALDNVNIKVKKGSIHALVGENGAGKSTLMNILSGLYPHGTYTGDIVFDGNLCDFKNIKQSEKKGIVIIHQELALIPDVSIAENMFLGNEQGKGIFINWNNTKEKAITYMKKLRLNDSPDALVRTLGVGKQQLVEIAKALAKNVRLLILDEPTAALNEDDSENLLRLLLELKEHGIASVLISHKLNEVVKVADEITILRDGKTIETLDVENGNVSEDNIICGMVGRALNDRFPKRDSVVGDKVFEVKNWTVYHPSDEERKMVDDVSFHVRKGEVVGIAGLMGAGRTELATSLFGKYYGKNITGKTLIDNKEVSLNSIPTAIKNGLAYVTEDRKQCGLVLIDNVMQNISLSNLARISKQLVVNKQEEILHAEDFKSKMNIKTPTILQQTVNLSGGNQQKVVLSKWIFSNPRVLILDEPTRGIDVGAKFEIYSIINQLAAEGMACIIISSEMPEVIGMSDRIYVMSEGKFTAELDGKTATQEQIMKNILSKAEV